MAQSQRTIQKLDAIIDVGALIMPASGRYVLSAGALTHLAGDGAAGQWSSSARGMMVSLSAIKCPSGFWFNSGGWYRRLPKAKRVHRCYGKSGLRFY